MHDVVELYRKNAKAANQESDRAIGAAETWNEAADILNSKLGGVPKSLPPISISSGAEVIPLSTPTPDPRSRGRRGRPIPPPEDPKQELMEPMLDLVREDGGWMSEDEIAAKLKAMGVTPRDRTLWRALIVASRKGDLIRRYEDDHFIAAEVRP